MLFCAVGRSGEFATATWDAARWCNINKNLIRKKTNGVSTKQETRVLWVSSPITRHSRYTFTFSKQCICHSVERSADSTVPWTACGLLTLANLKAGAAPTITKWLQEAMQNVQTYGSFTGTYLRVGAVNEIGAWTEFLCLVPSGCSRCQPVFLLSFSNQIPSIRSMRPC